MELEKYRYIVVEGPVGVGKTSLAKRLAARLGSELMLEKPEDNPFLPKFYVDMQRYAFATQMFFLFQRVHQVQALAQADLFNGPTVADFLLDKDPLFAELTLSDEEFTLYRNIYQQLKLQAPLPDLVIYLQASTDYLQYRVSRRGYAFEQKIADGYLNRLVDLYSRFFYQYDDAPLLIVNSENLNFVDGDEDFELLLQCISQMRGQRGFFNKAR